MSGLVPSEANCVCGQKRDVQEMLENEVNHQGQSHSMEYDRKRALQTCQFMTMLADGKSKIGSCSFVGMSACVGGNERKVNCFDASCILYY